MTPKYDKRRGKIVVQGGPEHHPITYNKRSQFLSLREIARFLNIAASEVESATLGATVPLRHIRVNGLIRVLQADLNTWLRLETRNEYYYERQKATNEDARTDRGEHEHAESDDQAGAEMG